MSTSVDVYALPKLPSTTTRGPTRICTCMLALLLVLVLVALAPSIVVSLGGDGVVVPTVAAGEAPLPTLPEAAQRFATAHAQWQAAAAAGLRVVALDRGPMRSQGGTPVVALIAALGPVS